MSWPVRCANMRCRARRVLPKHPTNYTLLPQCRRCRQRRYIVDEWRIRRRREQACTCGGYWFPHRRGSLRCDHYAPDPDPDIPFPLRRHTTSGRMPKALR